ncbi:MAG: class I SAM-dependent methyltransferase [Actinomycetota bacterium]
MTGHPVFARFYGVLERLMARNERPYREETAGGARGRVLEVGAGTGANLEHYPDGSRPVLVEYDPHMLKALRRRAAASRPPPLLVRASAQALPFRAGTFDTAVASLVLCTVPDPAGAASEIRRALAEGGELRFYEHVRASDPALAGKQDRWERVWGRFSGGCHPNRDTLATLRGSGFAVTSRSWDMPGGWIAAPHVVGTAVPGD